MKSALLCVVGAGLLLLSRCALCQAQAARPDSSRLAAADGLRRQYAQALYDAPGLYNGPEYVGRSQRKTDGHPFFESPQEQPATIEYGGNTYSGVPLRYDLVRGQLVLSAPIGGLELRLVNERVTRFTVAGHSFVRLVADSSRRSPLATGFYDLLVEGPVRVLGAYRKAVQEQTTANRVENTIIAKSDYFVRKDGRYYKVSKPGALLSLFPQNKAALRSYIWANNLKFSDASRGQDLAALVRYQATLAGPAMSGR